MGKFVFSPCMDQRGKTIESLCIIQPTVYGDQRGYFMETYNDEFIPYIAHLDGTPAAFVQDNESRSKQGVLRGLHFQRRHPQGKLVRVIQGEVYDVAVDLRRSSETYGRYFGLVLSDENKLQFYVPEGFAHGFMVLSATATFVYKCTRLYDPSDEGGILWNSCGIQWPETDGEILLSEKDRKNPPFDDLRDIGFGF